MENVISTWSRSADQRGGVALEFVLLFPFIVAILYGAGYYSVLFSWQYRMQSVVDAAVAGGMYLDRSQYNDGGELAGAVEGRANGILGQLAESLPLAVQESLDMPPTNCARGSIPDVDIEVIKCELEISAEAIKAALPVIGFGFLGQFPPVPSNGIRASAQVAF